MCWTQQTQSIQYIPIPYHTTRKIYGCTCIYKTSHSLQPIVKLSRRCMIASSEILRNLIPIPKGTRSTKQKGNQYVTFVAPMQIGCTERMPRVFWRSTYGIFGSFLNMSILVLKIQLIYCWYSLFWIHPDTCNNIPTYKCPIDVKSHIIWWKH